MKVWLKSVCAASMMALMLSTGAAAQSFEDGLKASDRADYTDAVRILTVLADKGYTGAQFALAQMYRQGLGVRQDPAQAMAWRRKAAEGDNPGAEFDLGLAYETGQGVPRSARTAAEWYAKAAARGYASAQVRLGVLYASGQGVPQSDETARSWFQKAADQGDPDGRSRLDAMAREDVRTPKVRFHAMMDRVFGPGRWRETSGYRSVAQEDALRRQGAGTVPLGERSHHSLGSPDAPGAYDIVVDGVPLQLAAARLRHSGEQLARVVAEGAVGPQGPHLHVEPQLMRASVPARKSAVVGPEPLRTLISAPGRTLAASLAAQAPHD